VRNFGSADKPHSWDFNSSLCRTDDVPWESACGRWSPRPVANSGRITGNPEVIEHEEKCVSTFSFCVWGFCFWSNSTTLHFKVRQFC